MIHNYFWVCFLIGYPRPFPRVKESRQLRWTERNNSQRISVDTPPCLFVSTSFCQNCQNAQDAASLLHPARGQELKGPATRYHLISTSRSTCCDAPEPARYHHGRTAPEGCLRLEIYRENRSVHVRRDAEGTHGLAALPHQAHSCPERYMCR